MSQAEVLGVLKGAPKTLGITKVKYEGSDLREVIREMLKEEYATLRKNKLTWARSSEREIADPRFVVGELRKDGYPYIGPIGRGRYFIQNGKLYTSNGVPFDIEKVSTEPSKTKDKDGNITEWPSDRQFVDECLASYYRTALALDPNLCPYCAQVSLSDRKAYMEHVYRVHPKEFLADVEGNEDSRLDIQAERHGEEKVPMPTVNANAKRPRQAEQ
jgi:hypothetical protein